MSIWTRISEALAALTDCIDRFSAAWEQQERPPVEDYLPEDENLRLLALTELVKLDLEYRWLGGSDPLYAEDYFKQFPELVTGLSAVLVVGQPDLAVGAALGCSFRIRL